MKGILGYTKEELEVIAELIEFCKPPRGSKILGFLRWVLAGRSKHA